MNGSEIDPENASLKIYTFRCGKFDNINDPLTYCDLFKGSVVTGLGYHTVAAIRQANI